VSRKLFSLIHGDALHAAPEAKIIPAEEFSRALEGKELLAAVQEDALKYRREVAEECEKLKEQAQKEGFEKGQEEWAEQLALLQKERQEVREEYKKALASVALKASQKIVGRAFEMSQDAIYDVVANALKPVNQHKRVTIYVNREDLETLERNRPRLKELFEDIEVLSIREREDVTTGGCIIETEGGIINAQLERQWAVLEKAFEKLFSNEAGSLQS